MPTTTAPHPTLTTPIAPASDQGMRAAAAEFFTRARIGRAQSALSFLRDGDSASCPRGNEWMRRDGWWIIPGQSHGLTLADQTITGWWRTRYQPDSKFALVHRLSPDETDWITAEHYTGSYLVGEQLGQEPVSGAWLRAMAHHAAQSLNVSVHLELPSGIVTLHSNYGDTFFHPAPADPTAHCA
ncbi:hypothetical protein [Streptomyces sp. NPDC048272]|uniref:hypothetical protein n=1 Tax=Streptomyces sp. NPDC048272 TaxID=3154616 RepID=UPI0034448A23